ncbi:hypothetical protein FUA23_17875 [Neolewinella aurantiaca]|uniref:Outer membrane protein beta-barrel domain-containing protein n=1 Tax=Neolewinella aurantiaca TaxID=2602767 RepID=A0A5C7FDY1_9BACT|nr:hypothetical protein [Neolewinella aurantiaca]TXF87680.1 hypothetical protein FUA23_17875 [Neolewinella aurantiaca]
MRRISSTLFFVFALFLPFNLATAQDLDQEGEYGIDWGGYLFGVKGGLSLGNQDWSGLETELLIGYHGDLYFESIPSQGRFSFYGQLGYHTRGSKISRRRGITFNGGQVTLPSDDFRFYNVSLGLGAKSVFGYSRLGDFYYILGLRADYNVKTNLSDYDILEQTAGTSFRLNYPLDSPDFIKDITYGASFGAGVLFPISEKLGGTVELQGHPDFSFQYESGEIDNVIDGSGTLRTLPARAIRNFTIEISFGLRFLRKWTYVD